jgi:chromate transporter
MMEEKFVRPREWVSRADLLDMLGASNLVPGPSSTEMAIHIGHQRGGWRGLVIAGVCFIVRAMLVPFVRLRVLGSVRTELFPRCSTPTSE